MPHMRPFYSDFFDFPLTEDVEELLARFQHTDSVRYKDFSAIWRDMAFTDVFLGIPRVGEVKRFCRLTLATAMKYFLPPYSYQIRVGGLYLIFAFYHTQPVVPPLKIRLALRDWDAVRKFLKDSVDAGHLDVIYIYQKLDSVKAIHYTAMPHFLDFQKQKKPKKLTVPAEFLSRSTAVQELISTDILEEMKNIQTHYEKLKGSTVEVRGMTNMINRDLAARLKDCTKEFITWQQKTFSQDNKDKNSGDEEEEEEEEEEKPAEACSSRARLLSSIKQKSYRNFQEAAKSRRHRQAETVESSSSGVEQVQEVTVRRRRPPSLRARTWKSLGLTRKDNFLQAWLLSAPEQETVPVKRINPVAPYRP